MFLKVLLLSIILVALVMILMSLKILLLKNGKFPNIHIGSNKEMKKRGIACASTQVKRDERASIKIKPLHLEKK